jgi:hypothetical protein
VDPIVADAPSGQRPPSFSMTEEEYYDARLCSDCDRTFRSLKEQNNLKSLSFEL